MSRILSSLARLSVALHVFALASAMLRFKPVYAASPLEVRALPLVATLLASAIVAAATGRARRTGPWRPIVGALAIALFLLAGAISWRGTAGLAGELTSDGGTQVLAAGPIDVIPGDLPPHPDGEWELAFDGVLRAPATGRYGFWVEGRGELEVRLAERLILQTAGERARDETELLVGRGQHRLEVRQRRRTRHELRLHRLRGNRLRLGWVRPRRNGAPGSWSEVVPPRYLGERSATGAWAAIDALAVTTAALLAWLTIAVPWDARRVLPALRPLRSGEIWASLAGYAVVLTLMSWPLLSNPARLGVVNQDDGRLNVWILSWVAHSLVTDPASLFDAPIFFPVPLSLALSENLLVPAVLAAPFSLAGEPVLGYNFALLLSYALSGVGVQLLVRRVTGDGWAAFVAGVLFAAGAHRWTRLAHLHAQATLFLPFALFALDRFWQRRTVKRGLVLGATLALQALTSIYMGAMAATAVALSLLATSFGGLRGRDVGRLVPGALLAVALTFPVGSAYLQMRDLHGVEWQVRDVVPHATTLESYVAAGSRLYGDLTGRYLDPERHRRPLFPGAVPLILGLAGIAVAPRRYRVVAALIGVTGVLISLGPTTVFYRWLHEQIFLFRGIRAVSRFALLPLLALVVLSGLAMAGRARLAWLALVLGLVEACNVPLRFGRYEPPGELAQLLAQGEGAVVHAPLGMRDTRWMLEQLGHFRPLVNGYSGLTPRHYEWAHELIDGAPGPAGDESLRLLRSAGVAHIVTAEELELALVGRSGSQRVYAVPPGETAHRVEPGRPVAVLWTTDGLVLDMGEVREAVGVTFLPSHFPWPAAPEVRLSPDGRRWRKVDATANLADAVFSLMVDPRDGRGAVIFERQSARFIALSVPARPTEITVLE